MMMNIERRRLLRAAALLPLAAVARTAEAATTNLVLNCDTALGPVMTAAAGKFLERAKVRVCVFPTGPGLVLPQLEREIQNDMICTRKGVADAAVQANLIAPTGLRGAWRNRLVIGVRRGTGAAALTGRIAVSDATPASDMDGPAIIQALGLAPSAVLGVIDTDEVAFLLRRGEADAGLLHMTDVQANPDLEVRYVVPDSLAPAIIYVIAVTTLARRPDPASFIEYLLSREGEAVLRAQGLEAAA